MLTLEIIGVKHVAGTRKDGSKYDFTQLLVALPNGWFEVFVNGETDLVKGDSAVFDLAVNGKNLQLVYTGMNGVGYGK